MDERRAARAKARALTNMLLSETPTPAATLAPCARERLFGQVPLSILTHAARIAPSVSAPAVNAQRPALINTGECYRLSLGVLPDIRPAALITPWPHV